MPSLFQRALAGGEISADLYARADTVKYQTAVQAAENFFIRKHGTMSNRPGTQLCDEVKDSDNATYIESFEFGEGNNYAIEIGAEYFRIYYDAALLTVSPSAYAGGTTYACGDTVVYGGVNYWSRVDGNVGNQPDISATEWYPMPADGTLEIQTPYAQADLSELKFEQSNDVVTITHQDYAVYELTRLGATSWSLLAKTFSPAIAAPSSGLTVTSSGSSGDKYVVTSVASETYEESVASAEVESSATATSGAPLTVSWTAVSGAAEYNVYKETNGVFGFIGVASGSGTVTFRDNGITADVAFTPPTARNPFNATGDYPATSAYYQQRQVFGGTLNDPAKVWTTRSALFSNMTTSSPLLASDAVTFSVVGKQFNGIRHIVDLNTMIVLTASGEYRIEGNADGILLATETPNPRRIGYNGASKVAPITVDTNLIYLGKDEKTVRDLRANKQTTYLGSFLGNDLLIYAPHLVRNKTITRMAYAQSPDSNVFCIRSDGVMLVLTYLPDQEIWGWTRFVTDGWFEDVCVIGENNVDVAYVVVKRIINGSTKRFVERFSVRDFTDVAIDAKFMDSHLSYDGRNVSATTLTLSTGAGWTVDDDITITASASTFVAGDVGNSFVLKILDTDETSPTYGEVQTSIKLDVTGYTSATEVTATPRKTVPAALQSVATAVWSRAVDQLSGLDHLEGEDLAIIGDGNVIATPLNDEYSIITVASGAVTLPATYEVIHAGLGYKCDIQTLALDNAQSDVRSRKKLVHHLDLMVADTMGLFAGPDANSLNEYIPVAREEYEGPQPAVTGLIEIPLQETWENSGSVLVRQKDPLPATVLGVIPQFHAGE